MFQETMQNEIVSSVTASAMAVAVIQWLKNTKWVPFINQYSSTLNRVLGWAIAAISAAGLHYNYESATGTLTLTGLTAATLTHSLWETTKSYALQWLIYKGIVKGPAQVAEATASAGAAPGQTPVVAVKAQGSELPATK
jgi:hypothetical protein